VDMITPSPYQWNFCSAQGSVCRFGAKETYGTAHHLDPRRRSSSDTHFRQSLTVTENILPISRVLIASSVRSRSHLTKISFFSQAYSQAWLGSVPAFPWETIRRIGNCLLSCDLKSCELGKQFFKSSMPQVIAMITQTVEDELQVWS
jgi:hypothetical protein